MSEYEGDADLEGMAGRVMELEGQLQAKEAIVEALTAEIDDLRTDVSSPNSSQSQVSSVPGRELISVYHNKFQEFEKAILQRDNLIEDLTASLQQALSARDALLTKVSVVSSAKLPDKPDDQYLKEEYETSLKHIRYEYEEKLKDLRDENRVLEGRHAKELAVFQSQLVHYKKTVETLKQELVNCATCEESVQAELNMYKAKVDELRQQSEKDRASLKESHQLEMATLNELLRQYKVQLEDVTAKYMAVSNVVDSKDSIAVSLERSLANKHNDLFDRYSGGHDDFVNNRLLNISRLSSNTFLSESNQTMYETINEMGIQCQVAKQKLDEKLELEKELVEKITNLEEQVHQAQMELQEANLTKRSYEKQLKDMKNMLDKLSSQSEENSEKKEEEVDSNVAQLDKLKQVVHVNRKLEKEVVKLRQGLAIAWSQCAEFTQHLSQSLRDESKFVDSFIDGEGSSKEKSEAYVTTCDTNEGLEDMPLEVSRLIERQNVHSNMLKQLEEEREFYTQEIDRLRLIEDQVVSLQKENKVLVAELEKSHEDQLAYQADNANLRELLACAQQELEGFKNMKSELESSYANKMEDLRVYFEQKCAQMEKQYSEDVFSQSSKKMLDKSDSEKSDDTDVGNENGELNSDRSEDKTVDQSKIEDKDLSGIISKYKNKLERLTKELEDTKRKYSSSLMQIGINQSCQTDFFDPKGDNSILELHTASLDFMDTADSDRLKLLEKLSGREELEDTTDKLFDNEIRDDNQYDVEILNIISAVKDEHQELESLAAIDAFKKTQLLCKTCIILNDYLEEIMHYIVACEKEISNCLVKQQDSFKHFFRSKFNAAAISAAMENNDTNYNENQVEEFHFVPHLTEISALINDDIDSAQNCENLDKRYLDKLRSHLRNSLVRFRDEIGRISTSSLKYMEFVLQNDPKANVETILNSDYQKENEELKALLLNAEQRLLHLEKRKEIITEGYGEQDELNSFEASQELSYVMEKAKSIMINEEENESPLIQVIEELYRCIEKLLDSGKREKDDLQLQIEAADKQLRATRKFLEEQATERENERDEAAKEISSLQEQLKEKEREKERDLRHSSEARMDFQIRELIAQLNELEDSKTRIESEHKSAVSKIILLKDIIAEREQHIRAQDEREAALQAQIEQLEEIIGIQTKNQEDLAQELETLKSPPDSGQMNGMITVLQDELKKHQISLEQYGGNSSALKQMKTLLHEMQVHLDKRTKELEVMHVCGSNLSLSQPSEDVSVRDQVDLRCPSPDDPEAPPVLPLDQVLKLKEKLLKNGRAEEAVLKKTKDLEMQLATIKNQNEELMAEHEMLQQTASEQLFQIEAMRGRLEQQKQNEPFVQKQVTSKLEFQLHESNNKLQSLERVITEKELEVIDLRARLERANEILSDKEHEMKNVIKCKEDIIKKLRDRLHVTEDEKQSLEGRLENYERVQIDLILDKNEEIDHLKDRLAKKDKELEDYLYSIPEDEERQADQPKNSARTLSDIVSINSEYEDMAEVLRAAPTSSRISSRNQNFSTLARSNNDKQIVDKEGTPVPPLDLSSDSPRNGSHEINSNRKDSPQINSPSANETLLRTSKNELQLANLELQEKLEKIQLELDTKSQTLENIKREIEGYKENNEYLHAKLSEVNDEFHSLLGRMKKNDEIMDEIKERNKELENENVTLSNCKEKCRRYESEIEGLKGEVSRLNRSLKSHGMIVNSLEEMVKQIKLSPESDEDFLQLSSVVDKISVPEEIYRDNKKAYEALEMIRNKVRELGNVSEVRKRLEKELKNNAGLQETVDSLREQLVAEFEQKMYYKNQMEKNAEMQQKNQKEDEKLTNSTSTSIDQDFLESIVQKYNQIRSQLSQFQKVNEELKQQKDYSETNNDILKSQVAEYEKRILDLKSELDDKNKQILILDKDLINEKSRRRALEIKIAKSQESLSASQQEDAELISCLRTKLTTSLESEEKLQNEVLALRQKVKNLEAHIGTILKSQPREMDITSYDEILAKSVEIQNKYITLVDDYQREKKNYEKLQNTLKKLESDKNRLKDSLGLVKEEKELLISKLTLVECKKDEIKSDFDRVKAQLKAKDEECRWLHTRIKEFSDVEAKQQVDAVDKMNNELVNFERKCNTSLESMVQYFYTRSQRSDSRKKALIFQKRYLICVLAGYQTSEDSTLAILARLTRSETRHLNNSYRSNKRTRPNFKSVVLLVISIQRMKWLISRWRLSKRVATDVILRSVEKRVLMNKVEPQRTTQAPNLQIRSDVLLREENKVDLEQYFDKYEDIQRNLLYFN